jgi:hypothetical protein
MDAESNSISLKRRSTLPLTRFWRLLLRRKGKGECVRFVAIPRRCLTRIAIEPGLQGEIKQDETGWKQAHLTIPVQGPNGDATAHGSAAGDGPVGLSRHSRRVLARCEGYALLNASNIAMLTGECRSY